MCDGKSAANLEENVEPRKCSFKILELSESPYNLKKDDEIWVQILAVNDIGSSAPAPGNGAVMKAVPSSPSNLDTDEAVPTD